MNTIERLKSCESDEHYTDEEFEEEIDIDMFETTKPTEAVYVLKRARMPSINQNCGLNISTLTEPTTYPTTTGTTLNWATSTTTLPTSVAASNEPFV